MIVVGIGGNGGGGNCSIDGGSRGDGVTHGGCGCLIVRLSSRRSLGGTRRQRTCMHLGRVDGITFTASPQPS